MLKSFEFGGGGGKVFTIILSIAEKLSDDDFEKDIQPVIIRMFTSQERGVRMCLLENLNRVIERLNAKVVNDKMFPNMVTLLKVNAYCSLADLRTLYLWFENKLFVLYWS